MTLIHDPSFVCDPSISAAVQDTLREIILAKRQAYLTAEQMGTLFLVIGAELMLGEKD